MNKKIIIGIVAAVVVIGGIVGTVLGVNAYQEKKAEEELKAQQEQLVKEFNDKINNIVNPLLVPDANGQNPSIENNNDVNALQTAITQLQNVEKEVTENTVITEEQKNTLKTTIATHITTIQNRINAVNEAEAQRQAEAEAQRQQAEAQARAEASKQTASTSSNKSSRAKGGSSSDSGSSNSGGSSAPADSGNSGGGSGYKTPGYQGVSYEEAKANAPSRQDVDEHPENYRKGGPGSW